MSHTNISRRMKIPFVRLECLPRLLKCVRTKFVSKNYVASTVQPFLAPRYNCREALSEISDYHKMTNLEKTQDRFSRVQPRAYDKVMVILCRQGTDWILKYLDIKVIKLTP